MTDAAPVPARQRRALLVTNIPNPYRIPLFNELSRQLEAQHTRLKVVFGRQGYRRRQWQLDMSTCRFDYEVLSSRAYEMQGDVEKTMFTYGGLFRRLLGESPDVVVVTGFSLATVQVWLYSWLSGTPYIIWTGSVEGVWTGQANRRSSRTALRTLQRKVLAARAAAFVAYGSKAREYLIGLGAPPESVHIGINTVDTRFFEEETHRLRQHLETEDDGKQHLTCIGYLSPRKGIVKLLRAVEQVATHRQDFVLDVVGDGEDRPRLEAYVQEKGLATQVRFHGYRQKEELPAFLARSRCQLFVTNYDIWGLVLVEAMAAGLPVIASTSAGATYDLVREGETGFAVDFDDTDQIASRINWVLDHPSEASAMGQRAQAFVAERVNIEKSAAGFVDAVAHVTRDEAVVAGTAGRVTHSGNRRLIEDEVR